MSGSDGEAKDAQRFIRGASTTPKLEIKDGINVFLSWKEKRENEEFINLTKRLLISLGLNPKTWRDSRSSNPMKADIDKLISECTVFIAFLTKDDKGVNGLFRPSGNIPGEIERALALGRNVIIFYERGTTIPSNIKSYYCNPFINDLENDAAMLIDLANALRKEGLLRSRMGTIPPVSQAPRTLSRGLDYHLRSLGVDVIDRDPDSVRQFKDVRGIACDYFSFIQRVQTNILNGISLVNYDPVFGIFWLWEYGKESVWYYFDESLDNHSSTSMDSGRHG